MEQLKEEKKQNKYMQGFIEITKMFEKYNKENTGYGLLNKIKIADEFDFEIAEYNQILTEKICLTTEQEEYLIETIYDIYGYFSMDYSTYTITCNVLHSFVYDFKTNFDKFKTSCENNRTSTYTKIMKK